MSPIKGITQSFECTIGIVSGSNWSWILTFSGSHVCDQMPSNKSKHGPLQDILGLHSSFNGCGIICMMERGNFTGGDHYVKTNPWEATPYQMVEAMSGFPKALDGPMVTLGLPCFLPWLNLVLNYLCKCFRSQDTLSPETDGPSLTMETCISFFVVIFFWNNYK